MAKTVKFPKELGRCIDMAYELRAKRLELEHQADELKDEYKALENHIFSMFKNGEIDGAKGTVATASRTIKSSAKVEDPDLFFGWVIKNKAKEFLYRACNLEAAKERWESGEAVPGVVKFDNVALSLTKIGGK